MAPSSGQTGPRLRHYRPVGLWALLCCCGRSPGQRRFSPHNHGAEEGEHFLFLQQQYAHTESGLFDQGGFQKVAKLFYKASQANIYKKIFRIYYIFFIKTGFIYLLYEHYGDCVWYCYTCVYSPLPLSLDDESLFRISHPAHVWMELLCITLLYIRICLLTCVVCTTCIASEEMATYVKGCV